MGIRTKVTIGFVSLALLVMGAGAVSFFELTRIGKRTQQILDASNLNMTISRELLDGAEMQHMSLLHNYSTGTAAGYDSLYLAGRRMFADGLEKGQEAGITVINVIGGAFDDYEMVAGAYFADSLHYDSNWLEADYWRAYMNLTSAIKEYMTGSEFNLGSQAERIEHNAYRAITPSLVTLGVILLLLFVLLFFIDIYYIKPVVKMNKSLDGFIKYHTPFNVSFEGKDEAFELKENIEELVDKVKRKNNEK